MNYIKKIFVCLFFVSGFVLAEEESPSVLRSFFARGYGDRGVEGVRKTTEALEMLGRDVEAYFVKHNIDPCQACKIAKNRDFIMASVAAGLACRMSCLECKSQEKRIVQCPGCRKDVWPQGQILKCASCGYSDKLTITRKSCIDCYCRICEPASEEESEKVCKHNELQRAFGRGELNEQQLRDKLIDLHKMSAEEEQQFLNDCRQAGAQQAGHESVK